MRNLEKNKYSGIHLLNDFLQMMLPSLIIFIAFIIIIFVFYIPFIEKQHMQNKEDSCRYLVDVVIDYLSSLEEDVGRKSITESEARQRALKRIRSLRYGKDHRDYFWIIDTEGVMLMHPFRRDIENMDPETIKGPDGELLSRLMLEMARIANVNPDGDTIMYVWNRWDNLTEFGTKVSFVKKFRPWQWIIGTGVYIDEAEKEISELKKMFVTISVFLGLFSSAISLLISYRAGVSRRKEEDAREQLLESEKNLRIREELFRGIFELSPHAIAITDSGSSRIINVNRAFCTMTGYSQDEIKGGVSYGMIHPVSDEEGLKMFEEIASSGVAENISSILISKDDRKKDIIYSVVPIKYMGEDSLLKMFVDLTEEKFLEEQLRQSQKMEVIGRLTGGIAHDFNNMLGAIIGNAEVLSLKLDPESDEKKYVSRILDTGEKGAELIRKLLIFSREGDVVFRNFDVHETILTVAEILGHAIDKRIKIKLNLNAGSSIISGDPTLIENALLNIALNSRDAMPEGGEIRFTTSNIYLDSYFIKNHPDTLSEGNYIEIDVYDTGSGIDPVFIRKIFEPFFTTKPSGKGTGLGLSAVYGTVREHKGGIDVYSNPGEFTLFKIFLPCNDEISELKNNSDEGFETGSGNILIIDDDHGFLVSLGEMLGDLGYTVFAASGGMDGVEVFRNNLHRIDLVICDIIMPEISGIETIKLLREIKDDIKVIVSSGYYDDSVSERLADAAVSGFLQKPYKMNILSRLLHAVLTGNPGGEKS